MVVAVAIVGVVPVEKSAFERVANRLTVVEEKKRSSALEEVEEILHGASGSR
jgi:hypothetical protein